MKAWYEKAVFYHMYPLGMTGAPKQNTEEKTAERFDELDRWIPHVKDLNCSAIYIGPLISLCHESGIRVVVDGVFNHTGRELFAFRDVQTSGPSSPYCGWYKGIHFDRQSPMGDSFGYESWQGIWDLACLNLLNRDVKDYLLEVVRYWVSEFDIDGIRLDCANVLDFQFMTELRTLGNTVKPDFWLMGEVIHGEYSRWVNDEMLHSITNYEMHKSIYSAHNDHNYFELAHNVRWLETIGTKLYTFVDNHDEDRIAGKLTNKSHLKPLYALLYTLPGIPSLYYGSEWGIEGRRSKTSDDVLRPCIPISEADERKNDLTEFIAKLGSLHEGEAAFHGGQYKELLLTNRQYAFARFPDHGFADWPGSIAAASGSFASQSNNSVIITAANNDDAPAHIFIPWQGAETEASDLLTGNLYKIENYKIDIVIEGNDAVILKISEED